ncbi:MAG TPA: hypothetical protein VFQ44_14280 [Streptosporangiaceae bacterium]|nr:hypothetical protein [Streptosporangiaceae bacterium]
MRIPLYLAIAQWMLLGALGLFVIMLFRQLGKLMSAAAPGDEIGPPLGGRASQVTYSRPGDDTVRRLVPGDGRPALVAFVDPTCPSCERLVLTLDQLRTAGELKAARVLLLISDPASYLQISEAFCLTGLEIGRPADRAGLDFYRVTGTPLLVAIDSFGTVRAAGSVTSAADVRRYLAACVGQAPVPAPVPRQAPASSEGR